MSCEPLQIIQQIQEIKVCAQNPVSQFTPFFLTATIEGQTAFTLPVIPLAIWVAINGTEQSQAKTPTPDFTVAETTLTLSSGIDIGDTVFGMIQTA
jgi:hypothetical protein